ncbi:hypothetical protein SRS16CHR_04931 [Variovorax sp. SRS16]|nr:hypothetical protein SRS16CHR_04931 [Variovorax sp. SRS16]
MDHGVASMLFLGFDAFYWTDWINIQYYVGMDKLSPTQWIAECAERLHEHWHTVAPVQLEEVAVDLRRDAHLRSMSPSEAAAEWLRPISSASDGAS